jgi:hypothetical protein
VPPRAAIGSSRAVARPRPKPASPSTTPFASTPRWLTARDRRCGAAVRTPTGNQANRRVTRTPPSSRCGAVSAELRAVPGCRAGAPPALDVFLETNRLLAETVPGCAGVASRRGGGQLTRVTLVQRQVRPFGDARASCRDGPVQPMCARTSAPGAAGRRCIGERSHRRTLTTVDRIGSRCRPYGSGLTLGSAVPRSVGQRRPWACSPRCPI